jgi:endonuclease/exonuclease/phosphatase family metal-dependent hydrolase
MKPMTFTLISLNTEHRVSPYTERQLERLLALSPQVIALQEVTPGSVAAIRARLGAAGYHVDDTLRVHDVTLRHGGRSHGILVASRWPLRLRRQAIGPWPEHIASASLTTEFGKLDLLVVHAPAGAVHGAVKLDVLDAAIEAAQRLRAPHRIVCGDTNTPQVETPDGRTLTWADPCPGSTWKPPRDLVERWRHRELRFLREQPGLVDVYREVNGWAVRDISWDKSPSKIGRRYDHIFGSMSLNPIRCWYEHDLRLDGLSDHSAIAATFDPPGLAQAA